MAEHKGVFTAGKGALIPQDDRAREIMAKLAAGDKVLVGVHKARWPEHHRLAWAFFDRVGDAIGKTGREVATWLKVATGRVDFVQMPNGKVVCAPQSISFESMSQDDFQSFWRESVALVLEHIAPDMSARDFADIEELIIGATPADLEKGRAA